MLEPVLSLHHSVPPAEGRRAGPGPPADEGRGPWRSPVQRAGGEQRAAEGDRTSAAPHQKQQKGDQWRRPEECGEKGC